MREVRLNLALVSMSFLSLTVSIECSRSYLLWIDSETVYLSVGPRNLKTESSGSGKVLAPRVPCKRN